MLYPHPPKPSLALPLAVPAFEGLRLPALEQVLQDPETV